MRILQVMPIFYPAWAYGGPVPAAYQLAQELVKRGHDVVVYTTDTIDARMRQRPKYMEVKGIKVFYFRNISNRLAWRRYFLPPGMALHLRKNSQNFDIIYVHGFRDFPSVFAWYYAKKKDIPYVLIAGGSIETYFHRGRIKEIFDETWGKRILQDAAKVIARTPVEIEQYKTMGVSEDKIEVVPIGIDLSQFENLPQKGEFRRNYGVDNSDRIILYLARIHQIKGPDLLAKAFAKLSGQLDDARLVIAGPDDGYLPQLKRVIKKLNIEEKVLFTGPLYGRAKLEAYVDADVYVLPSYYETFPVSILEALACGAPVIVTDQCGIADIIDGQAGLVVPCDEKELSKTMLRTLADHDMWLEFGQRGKALVREQFNWDKVAGRVEDLYSNVIAR